jgi:DNA mismatch repair protein MutL
VKKDGHIRLLTAQVANKVAAGEVVERPASVVKEMIENALDAGASRIDVTVTAGGRKLIEVRDNGSGMNRADALMCIERHSTSKIRDVHDIDRIATLGFRGEAIPSIASVSRFRLRTRDAQSEAGTELTILGGTLQDVSDAGVPVGTSVEVRDLFFNVPARRKFLRAYQTEQGHIKSVFVLNALAHPDVGFSLTCDGREQYRLPPDAGVAERVRELFGAEYFEKLRRVEGALCGIRVYGYTGVPGAGIREREQQYVFVNRRPATAAVIAYAIREAYAVREGDTRPPLILFIDLDPGLVDVNVHPAKREVRFTKASAVREAVIAVLRAALTGRPVPAVTEEAWPGEAPPEPEMREHPLSLRRLDPAAAGRSVAGPEACVDSRPAPAPDYGRTAAAVSAAPPPAAPPETPPALLDLPEGDTPWRRCRVIGELRGSYILLETDSGCVTVDPCAAMERILYERLMAHDAKHPAPSQSLLIPESVRLSPAEAERVRRNLEVLETLGFRIADLGDDHFMVEALPALPRETSGRDLLVNIADDIAQAGRKRGSVRWKEELAARAVSRTVASGSFRHSREEAEKLVAQLAACRMPYTCPQGKPTMIFTSYPELDRKFGKRR